MKGLLVLAGICACLCLFSTGCGSQSSASEITYSAAAAKRSKPPVPVVPTSHKLIVKDLIEGTGAEATAGKVASTHYVVGIRGKEMESFWHPNHFFGFTLGAKGALPFWEKGIPGMRVGGRRELIFPATPAHHPLSAKVGDTLVYIIDLVEVRDKSQPPR